MTRTGEIEQGQIVCAANGEHLGGVIAVDGDVFAVSRGEQAPPISCSLTDVADVRNGGVSLKSTRSELERRGDPDGVEVAR